MIQIMMHAPYKAAKEMMIQIMAHCAYSIQRDATQQTPTIEIVCTAFGIDNALEMLMQVTMHVLGKEPHDVQHAPCLGAAPSRNGCAN